MALPKPVPLEHIEKLERGEHEAFVAMLNNYETQKQVSDETKEQWLAVYSRCLSPSVACKQVGVSVDTYRKWRTSDPRFCRSLNACIEQAQEELVGSVMTRATGYVKPDENTNSGYEEDAAGKVVRFGASDQLAKAVLGLDKADRNQDQNAQVNVVINVDGLLGQSEMVIEHDPAHDE